MSESATPHLLWGNWAPETNTSQVSLVAVCDANGNIGWFPMDQVAVLVIDGKPPQHWLNTDPFR
jgi:hypothetical protein